jgi:hypothetical protein
LIPKLEIKLQGRRIQTLSDIQRESQAILNSIEENDFHGAFETWENQWIRCMYSQGDFFLFAGDGGQN